MKWNENEIAYIIDGVYFRKDNLNFFETFQLVLYLKLNGIEYELNVK